ncbi:MAG TPA: lysophospholipid acyltransferase family protein [Nevskiaceae bacterium]|nr:lysophospholipid acyltransferase family protein [Nevskiaceae bacterium]
MARRLLHLIYGVYASIAAVFVIFVVFCPLIIIAPTLTLRREIGRLCVRAALASAFVPFRIHGLEHLPGANCVVVANHSSYLDGLVLTAALPHRFTFMVKQAAASWPYIGLVIKRMGVRFVNRVSKREAAKQTLRLIHDLRGNMSLAVFAEGTFKAEPGLLPFQKGAFAIAAKAGTDVVPVAIRGTRQLYGAASRLLQWSAVDILVMPPLHLEDASPASVAAVRDAAHAQILAAIGEPNLAAM